MATKFIKSFHRLPYDKKLRHLCLKKSMQAWALAPFYSFHSFLALIAKLLRVHWVDLLNSGLLENSNKYKVLLNDRCPLLFPSITRRLGLILIMLFRCTCRRQLFERQQRLATGFTKSFRCLPYDKKLSKFKNFTEGNGIRHFFTTLSMA